MGDEQTTTAPAPTSPMSRLIDVAWIALIVLVAVLAAIGMRTAAIGVGVFILPVAGVLVLVLALGSAFLRRGHTTGHDFSSFSTAEEKAFIPHEEWMRANAKRAGMIGGGIALVGTLLAAAVVLGLYTPCSKYCERPPSVCKTDAQAADFRRGCESSCGTLERQKGQSYIESLTGCAFANSTGGSCEEITKTAQGVGLWCESK